MMAIVVVYWDTDYLRHKYTALVLILVALVFTVLQTALVPASVRFVNRRRVAVAELLVAVAMMTLDGFVRRPNVVFETGPTLGSWWPVVGLISASTYLPLWAAVTGGLSFGGAKIVSALLNNESLGQMSGSEQLALINPGVFGALAAATVYVLVKLMRNAESEVALVRAREEVARTLHDGVLQTLAIVERRTDDRELSQLARQQERDLRAYLFGQRADGVELEIGSALQHAARRYEAVFSGRVQVVVAPDLPPVSPETTRVVSAAVAEALTNAGKHANAVHITIYVEPSNDNGIFCSVKDDGDGFDATVVVPGVGLARSIRGRIEEAGGRVELKSAPGSGTEVLLWVP